MKTIFVGIASYRDPECQWTIKSLFENASNPDRIRVGILWQTIPEEDEHCFIEPYKYPKQIEEMFVHVSQAKGAGWAKNKALSMCNGEDYTMLIDSHMRFGANWDEEYIKMLDSFQNPKSLLSTYPAPYTPPNDLTHYTAIPMRGDFHDSKVPNPSSKIVTIQEPKINPFIAGGFIFAPSNLFRELEYDPYMYFHGEEIGYAVRLYTHGWDVYTPHICLIYHYYGRNDAKRQWSDDKEWYILNNKSIARIKHLLNIEKSDDADVIVGLDGKYGLGEIRTLQEYENWCGYYFADQVIHEGTWDK